MQELSVEKLLEAPAPAAKAKQPTSSPYINRIATADQALMAKERAKSSQGISSRRPNSPDEMAKRNSTASEADDYLILKNDADGDWKPYVESPMRAAGPGGYNDYLDSTGSKNKRATFSPQLAVANDVAAAS